MEVVDSVAEADAGAAAFLRSAKAYRTENGDVHIAMEKAFAIGLVDRPVLRDRVASCLSGLLSETILPSSLCFEEQKSGGDLPEDSFFDELKADGATGL